MIRIELRLHERDLLRTGILKGLQLRSGLKGYNPHVYLNSVQQMVSGELAGECLQTLFERHSLPPQRALPDTIYPLREHLNSVLRMVSGGYCEGLFPDTVCWTRLRNTWNPDLKGPNMDLCIFSFGDMARGKAHEFIEAPIS